MTAVTMDCATPALHDLKQRPSFARGWRQLRARDERGDRHVEAKNTDLADDVVWTRRREYAEGTPAEHPRDKKCKYPPEMRRQHRDRVQEAPRFSSTPVSSTRAGHPLPDGATSRATSVGLTDSSRGRSLAGYFRYMA